MNEATPDATATPVLPEAWTRNGLHSRDWEALPPPARLSYGLASLTGFGIPATVAAVAAVLLFADARTWVWVAAIAGWVLALGLSLVHGRIRWRRTRYRLDSDGLHIRRGLWWRSETLVPRTRVQHMDLERGPVERGLGLASLVVHTAGTRMNAVKLAGLPVQRGRELRNDLVDRDGDDDDAV